MARIFITGSADGLGQLAAIELVAAGHRVVLHARNERRCAEALAAVAGAEAALPGDLAIAAEVRTLAAAVNALGTFDAVIHNAAVGYREPRKLTTVDGHAHVFAINTLAPYMLTALIERPRRLIYLSSGLHRGADATLADLNWEARRWSGAQAYSDSKLQDALLAFAVARRWPDVLANALEPGWVPTKMGGAAAPDDLALGARTQAWLAASDDAETQVSGQYFFHRQRQPADPAAHDVDTQAKLLDACAQLSGVALPR